MNDQQPSPDRDDTETSPAASHTHRYPADPVATSGPGGPGRQQPPYDGLPPEAARRRRRGGPFTAGMLVAALVVGGLGGLAGVAGFAAAGYLDGHARAPLSSSQAGTQSSVSNEPDTPAGPGSVEEVAKSVLPSVVKINVSGPDGAGSGSGIILSADGEILTNNHVVAVAEDGGSMSVSFSDGTTARAKIVGTDPLTDLAIIKGEGVSGLIPASLGRSSNLDVGEEVVAIGSPFGLEATVTSGIVSALSRPVSVGEDGLGVTDTTYPAVQTDAAINPGNSGGPLANMSGQVVGVNSSIRASSSATGEGGSIGLGFAIPLDKVLPIVEQLRAGETPTHARIGVTVTDVRSEDDLQTGASIAGVVAGAAADDAGLQRGDVVTKVDDELITGSASLVATVRGHRPGDMVTLTLVREGDEKTIDVTLGSDEGSPAS